MEKYIDHINNDQYQLLKKDPTTKIKAKTLKQLKNSKDNKIIDNKPVLPVRPIVLYGGSSLYNLNKYMANILKAYVKDKNKNANYSTTFSNIRNVSVKDGEIMVSLTSLSCTRTFL